MVRYELKIHVDPSEKPNEECWLKLHQLLKTILEADTTACIYPWGDDHNKGPPIKRKNKAITDPKKLPTTPQGWKVYFDRANPIKDGGNIYPSVLLGHTTEFSELHEEVKWFLTADAHGWYARKLQVSTTRILGWLLYSLRTMNVDMIEEKLRTLTSITFAIRWRTISVLTRKFGEKLEPDSLIKALHVE